VNCIATLLVLLVRPSLEVHVCGLVEMLTLTHEIAVCTFTCLYWET